MTRTVSWFFVLRCTGLCIVHTAAGAVGVAVAAVGVGEKCIAVE